MRSIMNEHLVILKLDPSSTMDSIQRMQQAIDSDSYGADEYRRTRVEMTADEFIYQHNKALEFDCVSVYRYLGMNYIQVLENKTFWWSSEDGKVHKHSTKLIELENKMCKYLF
jgi:hypothetical protein